MGSVYLCYSAFYVSLSIPAMYFFLNVRILLIKMNVVYSDIDLHHAVYDRN